MLMMRVCLFVAFAGAFGGCTQMHQAQLGEVDSQTVLNGRRFELLISETGLNVEQAAEVAEVLLAGRHAGGQMGELGELIELFQMGPKTGNPVFDDAYADALFELLSEECPSGRITGLTSIRESANYPVVSGEIVKVVGYCAEGK